ncbi:MAG TPA: hypothetical protein VFG64_06195 [Dongiaceae bacterium]|nr:hypothetical protein [Dongiaceae bacterium]
MGERKTPNPGPAQPSVGNQPGKQFPDQNQQPSERASTPDRDRGMDHGAAAKRQARQDPLQKRDS